MNNIQYPITGSYGWGNKINKNFKEISDGIDDIVINVKEFGVVGDGVTNDTDALIEASEYCINNNKTLYIPEDCIVLIDNGTKLIGLKSIISKGAIKVSDGEVEIGYNSNFVNPVNYYIAKITGTLKLSGLKNSIVTVLSASKVILYANGDDSTKKSIAYSQFSFGKIDTLEFFSEGTEIGWINENIIYGGRFSTFTMDGNYDHNNNTFFKCYLEESILNITRGHNNIFHDIRFEANNTLNFASNTYNNLFIRSWESTRWKYYAQNIGDNVDSKIIINDLGSNNRVVYWNEITHNVRKIFSINNNSYNFNLNTFTRNENSLSGIRNFSDVFESGLVKVECPFGFILDSDVVAWRIEVITYDENKNKLTTDVGGVEGGSVIWRSDKKLYNVGSDISKVGFYITPKNGIKYIKIRVYTGSSMDSQEFSYLNLYVKEPKQSPVTIEGKSVYKLCSDSIPSAGTWNVGDKVYNDTPISGGNEGWVCVTGGSSGTWKTFGMIG